MRSAVRFPALIGAAMLSIACSGADPHARTDGGADGGDAGTGLDSGVAPPAEPTPPAMPTFTCPAGWRSAAAAPGDPPTCHPYPSDGPETCAGAEAHFLGEPGCTAIGSPCPAGEYPEGLPSDRPVVYVRAGAPAGGTGSAASPFATIAEAQLAIPSGGVIALAKGTHRGSIRLRPSTTLWGACSAETIVEDATSSADVPVIAVADRGVVVRDVAITGARPGVVVQSVLGEVELTGVRIAGVRAIGLLASTGARAVVRDSVVRDVAAAPERSAGIAAISGATIATERVVVERAAATGIAVSAATLAIAGLAVRDVQPALDGGDGGGLVAVSGAIVTGERLAVEHARSEAMTIRSSGTTVSLADVVLRDVLAQALAGTEGRGIAVREQASAAFERLSVTRAHDVGLVVAEVGSELRLIDAVVTDIEVEEASGTFGRGIAAQAGAELTIERMYAARCHEDGLFVSGAGTVARVSDARITDTQPIRAGIRGLGALVQRGARLEITRAALERNRMFAVLVADEASSLVASDVLIRDTQVQELDGKYGIGIQAQIGATATLTRARIESSRTAGALVVGGRLDLADVRIDGVEGDARGFAFGIDVVSSTPSFPGGVPGELMGERVLIANARTLGLAAWEHSTVRLADVVIERTRRAPCADTGACSGAGSAVGALRSGHIDLRRFLLSDNALCGAQLASGGEIDLHDGTVSRNVCGVNVQTDGFDVARLMDGVRYIDNESNLDATVLPVPDPATEDTVAPDAP